MKGNFPYKIIQSSLWSLFRSFWCSNIELVQKKKKELSCSWKFTFLVLGGCSLSVDIISSVYGEIIYRIPFLRNWQLSFLLNIMVSVHNGELRWTLHVLLFQGCSPYDVPIAASLPDSNFNASSVLSASFNEPYMAKLWGNSEWCPATASLGAEYFQVDFSRPFRVCAVDTQGHHTLSTWFVSSFNITYSLNESTWFRAQQNETNGVSILLMRPGDLGLNWMAHWRSGFET